MIFDGGCPMFAKLTWGFSHRVVTAGEMIFDGAKPRDLLFFLVWACPQQACLLGSGVSTFGECACGGQMKLAQ
jgi:hypothetical protein